MIKLRRLLRFIFIFCFCSVSYPGFCKLIPADGSLINYTSIYFEGNFIKEATEYKLVLYMDSLCTHTVIQKNAKLPAFWVDDLTWGSSYYWKLLAFSTNGNKVNESTVYKFSIMKLVYQGFDEIKVDVKINNEVNHSGGVMSLDYSKSIIDRRGKQIWAIPSLPGVPADKMYIRDMRITQDNTITFLTFEVPYELDVDGNIVWKAPYPFTLNKDTIHYHHDFKKTSRGTFMVLGDKFVYRPLLGNYSELELKNSSGIKKMNDTLYKRINMTTLLEFNKSGELIWYWDANAYLEDVDLNFKKIESATPNFATHANAFGENKQGTKIYIGFRDLSRIIKLDKLTKKVEWSWGELYPSGQVFTKVDMKNQHDASPSDHNSIYVYNNNGLNNPEGFSSLLELKDSGATNVPVIWKFDLNFDTLTSGKSINGGNIVELPNKNLLFCAGELNRVFEITKNKEIVWDAFLYLRTKKDTIWRPFPQYRVNWSKQLNRYYFLTQLESQVSKSQKSYLTELIIYNTGNAKDSYEIQVLAASGEILFKSKTQLVSENQSTKQVIKLKNKTYKTDVKILIQSQNSRKSKILSLRNVK